MPFQLDLRYGTSYRFYRSIRVPHGFKLFSRCLADASQKPTQVLDLRNVVFSYRNTRQTGSTF